MLMTARLHHDMVTLLLALMLLMMLVVIAGDVTSTQLASDDGQLAQRDQPMVSRIQLPSSASLSLPLAGYTQQSSVAAAHLQADDCIY